MNVRHYLHIMLCDLGFSVYVHYLCTDELDDGVKAMRILAGTLTVVSKKEMKGMPIPATEYWLSVHPISTLNFNTHSCLCMCIY